MKFVFVCKYNRFRSKLAESYFNKIRGSSNHFAKSAGLIMHKHSDAKIRKFFKKHHLSLNDKFNNLDMRLLKWSDVIIIVANDIPTEIFDFPMKLGKKIVVWKIKDVEKDDDFGREIIFKEIKKKVDSLVNLL